jgi:hypothetical protein
MTHPFCISQRVGANPVEGLSFVPTIEPAHSDRIDYYPEIWRPENRRDRDVSKCNEWVISKELWRARCILEIGIHNDGTFLMREKDRNAVYIGIDIADRKHLRRDNVYTIQMDSKYNREVIALLDKLRLRIDLLFIDGFHSIEQTILDWQYTSLMTPDGTVLLHDTNYHPGPIALFEAIDPTQWLKQKFCLDPDDYGIAVAWRQP